MKKSLLLVLIFNFVYANNKQTFVLFKAAAKGNTKKVESMIVKGVDINASLTGPKFHNETPLFVACQNGHQNVVATLLKHGANINQAASENATPLFIASQNGYKDVVEVLIKHGANINITMDDGESPLSVAKKNGHKDVVEVLLANG